MRPSALLVALPAATTAGHQLVELGLGSGVIGQHLVGLRAASALSFAVDAGWVAMALSDRHCDRPLALGAGTAIAAPVLHYTLFPWRLRFGVPVLEEAEGQRGMALLAYVALLYVWGLSGVAAVHRLPRTSRRWTWAGMAAAVAFRQLASSHLAWIRQEAQRNPRWWNRAWSTEP